MYVHTYSVQHIGSSNPKTRQLPWYAAVFKFYFHARLFYSHISFSHILIVYQSREGPNSNVDSCSSGVARASVLHSQPLILRYQRHDCRNGFASAWWWLPIILFQESHISALFLCWNSRQWYQRTFIMSNSLRIDAACFPRDWCGNGEHIDISRYRRMKDPCNMRCECYDLDLKWYLISWFSRSSYLSQTPSRNSANWKCDDAQVARASAIFQIDINKNNIPGGKRYGSHGYDLIWKAYKNYTGPPHQPWDFSIRLVTKWFIFSLKFSADSQTTFKMAEAESKTTVPRTHEKSLERENSSEDGVEIPKHTSFVNVMVW